MKATVRADARTLPEATTRRAALGTIIAAGAIGVVPIAAGAATAAENVSAPAGLDAGLFALIDEAREAGARVEAAIDALEEAQERTEEVPWPQALIVTEDDTRLWKLKAGDPFDHGHLYRMRIRQAPRQKFKDSMSSLSPAALAALASGLGPMDDKDRAAIEKMRQTRARISSSRPWTTGVRSSGLPGIEAAKQPQRNVESSSWTRNMPPTRG
jgi:hypothetical protein